jgi:hypothetical protein
LKNVGEAASARQKQAKKRSLRVVNEHFEPVFNVAMATQVVFQQPANVTAAGGLSSNCQFVALDSARREFFDDKN